MARPKATLELSGVERSDLQALARRRKTAQAAALRARIVLACAEGTLSLHSSAKEMFRTSTEDAPTITVAELSGLDELIREGARLWPQTGR